MRHGKTWHEHRRERVSVQGPCFRAHDDCTASVKYIPSEKQVKQFVWRPNKGRGEVAASGFGFMSAGYWRMLDKYLLNEFSDPEMEVMSLV